MVDLGADPTGTILSFILALAGGLLRRTGRRWLLKRVIKTCSNNCVLLGGRLGEFLFNP